MFDHGQSMLPLSALISALIHLRQPFLARKQLCVAICRHKAQRQHAPETLRFSNAPHFSCRCLSHDLTGGQCCFSASTAAFPSASRRSDACRSMAEAARRKRKRRMVSRRPKDPCLALLVYSQKSVAVELIMGIASRSRVELHFV